MSVSRSRRAAAGLSALLLAPVLVAHLAGDSEP